MSRCFPYPPPGYTLSGHRNQALIESIKLQKEKQKRKEKREKRKEKKEKPKEKKERRKEKTEQETNKPDILKGLTGQKNCSGLKVNFLHKSREAETEQQLELSSLTEEHARPVSLSGPSYSSDSTENSNKRKRSSSPENGSHGKIILIRLPSKNQSNFDALAKKQQPNSPIQVKDSTGLEGTLKGAQNTGRGFTLRSNPEHTCSTSGQIEAIAPSEVKPMPNAVLTSIQRDELKYSNLLGNLFPPQLQDACLDNPDDDDLDWLLKGKNQEKARVEKRQRCGNDGISLWPRAEYLHEVNAYALPFTVLY